MGGGGCQETSGMCVYGSASSAAAQVRASHCCCSCACVPESARAGACRDDGTDLCRLCACPLARGHRAQRPRRWDPFAHPRAGNLRAARGTRNAAHTRRSVHQRTHLTMGHQRTLLRCPPSVRKMQDKMLIRTHPGEKSSRRRKERRGGGASRGPGARRMPPSGNRRTRGALRLLLHPPPFLPLPHPPPPPLAAW